MLRVAEVAPECLLGSLAKKKEDSLIKLSFFVWPTHRNEADVRRGKDAWGVIEVARADRHLINTAQRPSYGQIYSTGCLPTHRPIVKFLAIPPATFPDTSGGKLVPA